MKAKWDVTLQYKTPEPQQTFLVGCVSENRATKYFRTLSAIRKLPEDTCLDDMTLYRMTLLRFPMFEHKQFHINFTTIPRCKCPAEECLRNLCAGECTDEFVIEHIGKMFFPDKYKDKQIKQR